MGRYNYVVSIGLEIVLVRHGETDWNLAGLVQGHTDEAHLTARGRQQAEALAEELAGREALAIYSSDLARARETASPIARRLGLNVVTDSRLRERNLGVLESGPASGLVPGLFGVANDRVTDEGAAPEGGESIRQFYERTASFLVDLAEWHSSPHLSSGRVIVVCHGGTVRMALCHLDGAELEGSWWGSVANGAVNKRTIAPLERSREMEGTR